MADVMQELCDYEKRRLENVEKNIELMKTLGLDVKSQKKSKIRKWRRRRYSNCSNSSSDSGDEWIPALETCVMKKKTKETRVTRALKRKKPQQKKYYKPVEGEEPSFESLDCKLSNKFFKLFGDDNNEEYKDFEGFDIEDVGDVPQCPVSERYPKRLIQLKEYREDELSDEDEYLFCDNCDEIHLGDCPVHGPLLTLDPSSGHDEASLQYTNVFVPSELTVKPSKIANAGLGVFATQFIPRGVRFGPYEGRRVLKEEFTKGEQTSYMWEVKRIGERSYYIDGQSDNQSNWLRFVNCARNVDEQNLIAFQYYGNIYYRSFKHIYPGNELYVWYGEQYARELGITASFEEDDCQLYNCKNCGSSFVLKANFNLHLRLNSNCLAVNPQCFTCQKCQESFCELYQLQDHIRKHEQLDVKERNHKKELISNDELLVNNADNMCDYCGKKLSCKSSLRTHLRIHTGDKPYQCQYCGKVFGQTGNLQRHLRIHTGDKPYQCQYCGKEFRDNGSLQRHLRVHTGDKPYQCKYCGKGFSHTSSLQRHLCIHTGDKPYQCEYCGKGFSEYGNLQNHLRVHTGDKPYQCHYCEKGFSTNTDLRRHIHIHTGDKPYQCQYCGKGFSHNGNLQTHLRIHTGDKPFQCQYCGKEFRDNGGLQRHLRVHTGDKPYQCQYCGKGFKQSSNLQTHVSIHTGDKPHQCQYCRKGFRHNHHLQAHLRIHTGNLTNGK